MDGDSLGGGLSFGGSGLGLQGGTAASGGGYGFGPSGYGQGLSSSNVGYGGGSGGFGYGLTDSSDYGYTPTDTSSDLSSMFSPSYSFDTNYSDLGFNPYGSEGLQMSELGPTATGYGVSGLDAVPQQQSFFDSPLWKVARTVAGFTPLGRVANIAHALGTGNMGNAVGGAIGGLPGAAVGMGINAAQGKDISGQAGGTLGGMFGSAVGGPVGGFVGGLAGSALASKAGSTGPGTTSNMTQGGGNGVNFNNIAQGLATLYAANQANKTAQTAQSGVQDLSAMFGPNSAYAQQMRQTLERQDAKAGRRSQYGAREVDLQAKLADMAARYGPGISQQNIAASQAAQTARNNQLAMLLEFGKKSGAIDYLGKGLENIFNNQQQYQYPDLGGAFSTESSPEFYQDMQDYGVF